MAARATKPTGSRHIARRALLRRGFWGMGILSVGPTFYACGPGQLGAPGRSGTHGDAAGPYRGNSRLSAAGSGGQAVQEFREDLETPPRTLQEIDAGTPAREVRSVSARADIDAGMADHDANTPVPLEETDAGLDEGMQDAGRDAAIWMPQEPVKRGLPALGFGPLLPPDDNGLRLPAGCHSRIVARSGQRPTPRSDYKWHGAPDGGATFATEDGGWIYVSNCELGKGNGGVGALRFAKDGTIEDAYSLLKGTARNCAGGLTPWGTWLTCEEVEHGKVVECDPTGQTEPIPRPALGLFRHEAVAVDPKSMQLYLTEDQPDGLLYRFTPDDVDKHGNPNLDSGLLEAAVVLGDDTEGYVEWVPVGDPRGDSSLARRSAPKATGFRGGEGIWYDGGIVYFTTKGDNRVWALDPYEDSLVVIYDRATSPAPILSGVDNVTASPGGHILVAEDGGDMQIVALGRDKQVAPIVQVVGHKGSEVTGPAFDPSGTRLYFSSQRGPSGSSDDGVTFEVTGLLSDSEE